jgi:hypothetical protein
MGTSTERVPEPRQSGVGINLEAKRYGQPIVYRRQFPILPIRDPEISDPAVRHPPFPNARNSGQASEIGSPRRYR